MLGGAASAAEASDYPLVSLEEVRRVHARRVVEALGDDKVRAAAILGVSRATLYRLLSDTSPETGSDEDANSANV
jgi:DNA-binding NtrC family response regulator